MNYLQWLMFGFWFIMGFGIGYLKGYDNAKTLWFVKGKMAGRNGQK